jgi:hypothetical protein
MVRTLMLLWVLAVGCAGGETPEAVDTDAGIVRESWTQAEPGSGDAQPVVLQLAQQPVPWSVEVWVVDGAYTYGGVQEGISPVEDRCDRPAGCFFFAWDPVRRTVSLSGFVPSPGAVLHVRYRVAEEG